MPVNRVLYIEAVVNSDVQCVILVCFNQRPSLVAVNHVDFAGEAIYASVRH